MTKIEVQLTKEQAVAKIIKLLALSKSSNQHEAELAAKRASDMMEKYQIDSASTELQGIKEGRDPVTRQYYKVGNLKMRYIWVERLAVAASKAFDGLVLIGRELHGTSFTFVGMKSEIPMMQSLFEHLYAAWTGFVEADLAIEKVRTTRLGYGWAPRDTMKFKLGHGQGYADALLDRCTELSRARNQRVQAQGNACTALVLVRGQAIAEWRQANGVHSVRQKQATGAAAGQRAGAAAGRIVPLGGALT